MNLFHLAIRNNNVALFNQLLEPYQKNDPHREDINEFEKNTGYTPLQLAVFLGRFDMAVQLLIQGADPSLHHENHTSLQNEIKLRNYGELFANLILLSSDLSQANNSFSNDIKINPDVFHILLFSALLKENENYAMRLLKKTLPYLDKSIQTEIINKLTGALYYAIQHDNKDVAKYLVELGVNKIDDRLPNPGVSLVPWLPSSPFESKQLVISQPLSDKLVTKNYLELKKISIIQVDNDTPINRIFLPWLMLFRVDLFGRVNSLLKQEKWEEIKEIENAGYSLDLHIHALILQNNENSTTLLNRFKKYPGFENNFFSRLFKIFIFAVRDNLSVNEHILNLLLNLKWGDEQEFKTDLSIKNKLIIIERHLLEAEVSPIGLQKFIYIKNDLLANKNVSKDKKNSLDKQPATILWKITTYLNQKDIYWNLSQTTKYHAALATQDRLAYVPSVWLRYNNLDQRVQEIEQSIDQLKQFNKLSFEKYCFGDWTRGNCLHPCWLWLPSGGSLGGDALAGCATCCPDPATCCHACAPPTLSTWLIVNIGIPLTALIGIGCTTRYYCCDTHLPGKTLDDMTEEQKIIFNDALKYLPTGINRPGNTKMLITALEAEKHRLRSGDEKARMDLYIKQSTSKIKSKEVKYEEDFGNDEIYTLASSQQSIWNERKIDDQDKNFNNETQLTELLLPKVSIKTREIF